MWMQKLRQKTKKQPIILPVEGKRNRQEETNQKQNQNEQTDSNDNTNEEKDRQAK